MGLSQNLTFYQRIQSTRDVVDADKTYFAKMLADLDAYNKRESQGLDSEPIEYSPEELGSLSAYRSLVMLEELKVRTGDVRKEVSQQQS